MNYPNYDPTDIDEEAYPVPKELHIPYIPSIEIPYHIIRRYKSLDERRLTLVKRCTTENWANMRLQLRSIVMEMEELSEKYLAGRFV